MMLTNGFGQAPDKDDCENPGDKPKGEKKVKPLFPRVESPKEVTIIH